MSKRRGLVASAVLTVTGALAFAPAAFAGNTGTASVTIGAGGLSVTSAGNSSMTVAIGATGTGNLGTANWADATGSGAGWNGTVALSSLTYTGQWAPGTSHALATNAAGTYTGTSDGIWFKVAVTSASASSVSFSYTSNYTGDTSGTGTASLSGGNLVGPVGSEGVTISFNTSGTYTTSDSYVVDAGTQVNSMTFSSTNGPTITSTGTTSVAPVYYAANTTQAIGNTGLKFLDALPLTGMSGSSGYYTAAPGVSFTPDSNSWAATYSGTVTYSITSGP